MVKKLKKNKPIPADIRKFPISKTKTFTSNLNAFIRMLETRHPHLSSRQFISEVHAFIARYRQHAHHQDPAIGAARQRIRICRSCDGWSGNHAMLQCSLCEDFYHIRCLGDAKQAFEENGLCQNCQNNKLSTFDKNTYLTELIEDRCFKCDQERKDKQAFVHCLRCSKRFHKKCYGKYVAVCTNCKSEIQEELKKKSRQSTLLEYGCSSSKKKDNQPEKRESKTRQRSNSKSKVEIDEATVTAKFSTVCKAKDDEKTQPYRQKDLFCNNYMEMDNEDIENYKQGLIFAILAKNMKYTQRLKPIDCSLDINTEQSLDFGLDHMTYTEQKVYENYKRQPIGPFKYVFTPGMGYDVISDRDIREKTLICEYIGEVVTLRKCIEYEAESKNDSLMELRVGCNSNETLIIRPEKYTNMARFINGINNSKSSNKANVATVRKLAKGMPTVILYSIRAIKKGESLLYDYNAGSTNCKYDTSNFL